MLYVDLTPCAYLGKPIDVPQIKVECYTIDGRMRKERLHACRHPRLQSGPRPPRCIPDWPGPWRLPEREAEAALYRVCAQCELKEAVS